MNEKGKNMTKGISTILAFLLVMSVIPAVHADDDYLDGGFMGMPSWLYFLLDPEIMNNIIGVVHGHTLFEPTVDLNDDMEDPFEWHHPFFPRMKHWIFW
jgi:hypothetical protein